MSDFANRCAQHFALGARLIALGWVSWGCFRLGVNLLSSWQAFDPTYARHFFWSQMAVPGVALLVGSLIWVTSPLLGRVASRFVR